MSVFITIIHVIVCLILILAVLLQSGKAADLAGAFGGIGSQSVFGPRGAATLLTKLTTISAILFMITSLGLWILSGKGTTKSVLSGEEAPAAATEVKKEAEEPTAKPDATQPEEKKEPSSEEKKGAETEKKAEDTKKKLEEATKKPPEQKKN